MFGVDTPRFVESLPSRGEGEEQTSPSTRLFLSICLPFLPLPPPCEFPLTGELLTGIVQTCDIYHALLTTSRRSKCIISINVEGIARSRLSIALNWNNGPSLSVGRFENSNGNGRGTSIRFSSSKRVVTRITSLDYYTISTNVLVQYSLQSLGFQILSLSQISLPP